MAGNRHSKRAAPSLIAIKRLLESIGIGWECPKKAEARCGWACCCSCIWAATKKGSVVANVEVCSCCCSRLYDGW